MLNAFTQRALPAENSYHAVSRCLLIANQFSVYPDHYFLTLIIHIAYLANNPLIA